jgi:ankyrin repeat protein
VDLEKTGKGIETMLGKAIQNCEIKLVRYLLQLGADANNSNFDKPLILLAASNGNEDIIEALLDCGAGINMADSKGWTALHFAAFEGHEDVTRLLLFGGANKCATTKAWEARSMWSRLDGQRRNEAWQGQPLHVAAVAGRVGVVRLLLSHGVDPNATTRTEEKWHTALHIVLNTEYYSRGTLEKLGKDYLEIAQVLVEAGADVSGVANHLRLEDVAKFIGFEDLWGKLTAGITE